MSSDERTLKKQRVEELEDEINRQIVASTVKTLSSHSKPSSVFSSEKSKRSGEFLARGLQEITNSAADPSVSHKELEARVSAWVKCVTQSASDALTEGISQRKRDR